MQSVLIVIFENESKAYEGLNVLQEMDLQGSITVYAHGVVVKNAKGASIAKGCDDTGPSGLVFGALIGALVGALGGPAGLAAGALVGSIAGEGVDLSKAGMGRHFLDDVARTLLPGRAAVIAEIQDLSPAALDAQMTALGGTVSRLDPAEVKQALLEERHAAIKVECAQEQGEKHAAAEREAHTEVELLREKAEERHIQM